VNVVLEGHTDATGDATANKALSLQRAEAVKQMLVTGGVAADRIEAQGYGQDRPVAENNSDAGRALNRRLELVVTKR
jgi:OmpA-OmpF porin, OOP family